ncbi:hypothetical protein JZ751_026477 [Albula glossodonta]|uniref:Uncharacterized protein n=1 Tax=Albula glossodonta TaxID=121402 RepID=A0A8T2PC50_9TELE|nr:hypothetical protein JZ751_026477 [Albula glossodonta]
MTLKIDPALKSVFTFSSPSSGRPLQPQLDLKHFLPFRLNGSSPLSLFPNFNTVSPIPSAHCNRVHAQAISSPVISELPQLNAPVSHTTYTVI